MNLLAILRRKRMCKEEYSFYAKSLEYLYGAITDFNNFIKNNLDRSLDGEYPDSNLAMAMQWFERSTKQYFEIVKNFDYYDMSLSFKTNHNRVKIMKAKYIVNKKRLIELIG